LSLETSFGIRWHETSLEYNHTHRIHCTLPAFIEDNDDEDDDDDDENARQAAYIQSLFAGNPPRRTNPYHFSSSATR